MYFEHHWNSRKTVNGLRLIGINKHLCFFFSNPEEINSNQHRK